MQARAAFVRSIQQKDDHVFTIEWTDGMLADYRLSELQKRCPCASCVDESTGKRILDRDSIDDNVRAKRVKSVGRYALRVDFTSGCSNGIFGFDLLRIMNLEEIELSQK